MEFKLTPHILKILCGRGFCKDGKLICCAKNCLFAPKNSPDPYFGREIEPKGETICPRCKHLVKYPDDLVWNERKHKSILLCPICKKQISMKSVKWTQVVVSRHRRKRHEFYHKECWEAMFYSLYTGKIDDSCPLIRIIKWIVRVGNES